MSRNSSSAPAFVRGGDGKLTTARKKKEEEDDMTNSKNNKLGASMLNVIAGSSPPAVSRCRSPPRAVLPAPVDFSSCAHVNEG